MADSEENVTPEHVAAYHAAGRELLKDHPDLNDRAAGMDKEGFNFSHAVTKQIVRLARPDIFLYLVSPEGRQDAHDLLSLKDNPARSLEKLERIAGRLTRQGYAQKYERKLSEEDAYIQKRAHERRYGHLR